jgi:hypothetical protein
MTRSEVINLREELNKVLEKFNNTSPIKMRLETASYGDEVKFKLIGSKVSSDNVLMTKKMLDFGKYQDLHGFKPIALNYKFKHQNKEYEITGYNTRAKKYPMSYSIDGVPYKCSESYLKNIIKTSAPELLF